LGVKGFKMEQCEERIRRLLEMSADIHGRMAEIWALREAVRMAEASLPGAEQFHPALIGPSLTRELRA
jgi:hypothetical protein